MERSYNSKYLLVNETFIVDQKINELWLEWFSENFVMILSASDKINDIVFSRILHHHNPDGITYALQYRTESKYIGSICDDKNINEIRAKMFHKFQGLIASFMTEMEILEQINA